MGLLALKLLMSRQRGSKHLGGQIQARNRSVASAAKRKISSCQHSNLQGCKRMAFSGPDLPEDIWRHIHSLLPLRDAARVASVSHAFLRSWKCHPNLTFSRKALGLNGIPCQNDVIARDLTMKVDHILKKHSGKGVKKFRIELYIIVDPCYLNSWLQIATKLRIEELAVVLPSTYNANCYDFPCALFVDDGCRNTIEHLCLGGCAFHPTAGFGNLRRLQLFWVRITVDELGCLIFNSSALEHLTLKYCNTITYLKIPSLLQHLSYLMVSECTKLQLIECKAPNLSTFYFNGGQVKLLFGDSVQVKTMGMCCFAPCNTIYNARANLPSIVPNIETLSISSVSEVSQTRMKHDSVFGDPSHLRQRREYRHENIKTVKISGFCSAKSMVELTCHILENATSLECLMLDTIDDVDDIGRHVHETGECNPIGRHMIKEAREALLAIESSLPHVQVEIFRKFRTLKVFTLNGRCSLLTKHIPH
ncbi:unnamed protein product [Triticum turgidum subsp. durum]|uniref:F-box domain-containing protein n=1 Tax=Triticum turgidum subsp. durum TaxID=4567 RepID=A0A9R0U5K2_TRITD|nr:unnamed protein product [Triticum turgidum subsp. durum]